MDLGTGVALFGSAKLVVKLLGPTADYIGEGVKDLAEKRVNNVKNIFSIAAKKLGDKIDTEGAVPPKVLKGILDEGSFCDDPLAAEYFGGLLASSRSGISRDDRGATFIALINSLSTYQIRAHYILYQIIKDLFNGTDINIGISAGRQKMETYVPANIFVSGMEFNAEEGKQVDVLMNHIMIGLRKEHLIEDNWLCGPKGSMSQYFKDAKEGGAIFQPSALGVELFLWAHGRSDLLIQQFLDPTNEFEIDSKVIIKPGYRRTKTV